jgi:APA family basic amino acid/polyamine antiporter
MSQPPVARNIGLVGAVFTLVGYVIGASIFILPGQLAADAGPGAFLAYLIAGGLAALSCVVGAAIGSAVPVSGAAAVAAARTVAPVIGFLGVWATLGAVVVSIALVGFGLADYVAYFVPGVSKMAVALGAVVVFGLLNLTTVQLAVWVQVVMTVGFLVIMYGFGIGGTLNANPALLDPLLPKGWGAVATASVLAFFSYAGVTVITEIGGEIKNPGRTIPLALFLGFLVILSSYTLVSFAVPALIPWQSLAGLDAPIAKAAEVFLPVWVGGVIAVAALLAAATSINGMLLIHSRDVLAMARAEVFPPALAARHPRTGVPTAAVILVTGLSMLAVLVAGTIRQYAMFAVLAVMLLQIFQGLTLIRLPGRLPEAWAASGFRLRPATRWVVACLLIAVSVAFFALGVSDSLVITALFVGFVGVGIGYYYWRRRVLAARGYDLDEVLRTGASAEG